MTGEGVPAPAIPAWTPPWPTRDTPTFLRISATALSGDTRWACAEQLAKKARPQVSPQREGRVRPLYPPFEDMPLGLVREAVYSLLRHDLDPERALAVAESTARREVTDPVRTAARAGIAGYLSLLDSLRASGELPEGTVVRDFIALDTEGRADPARIEWYGWGILHISRDSSLREYHLLTWSRAGRRERSAATLGVYARIAADAVCVDDDTPWWEPRTVTEAQPRPGHEVRVRELGLLDASESLRYSGTVDQARSDFTAHVPPALGILAGGSYNPGAHCSSCAIRPECSGVPRLPGLLGVAGVTTWPRSLSPADLGVIDVCSWQVHLGRTLGLPRERGEPSEALRRGIDVHAWLEWAHGRRQACTPDDLPLDDVGEIGAALGWDLHRYVALRPYLMSHIEGCPLLHHDPEDAYPEVSLSAWDTDVDVMVATRADLVYLDEDAVVLRETKTVYDVDDTLTDDQLLHRYPQLALTLCLVADGLDPLTGQVVAPPRHGRVELELLHPDGASVRSFDIDDPATVLLARTRVAEAVDHVLYDSPRPTPGRWCSWCPVSQWCEVHQGGSFAAEDAMVDDTTGEHATSSAPAADMTGSGHRRLTRPGAAILALAETILVGDDEDIPF